MGSRYYNPTIGRFITPDTIVPYPSDPQSLNRYSYARNNPVNILDPTGHKWSWKKFWHAAVGALVGVVAGILAGPAGFAIVSSVWAAGAIGGAVAGAITGGLDAGWRGALMGGLIGGALGGLGGWAGGVASAHGLGLAFVGGMIGGGAAYASETGNWASFTGGLAGSLVGWGIGEGITTHYKQQFANYRAGNGFKSNAELPMRNALNPDQNNPDKYHLDIYNRKISDLPGLDQARLHPIMKISGGDIGNDGFYTELDDQAGKIHIRVGDLPDLTQASQAYMATNPHPDAWFTVSATKIYNAIVNYINTFEGTPYHFLELSTQGVCAANCIGYENYLTSHSQ